MARRPGAPLTIDCDTCPVQHVGCADCMVTAMLSPHLIEEEELGPDLALDRGERELVTRLVASGLVTPETASGARARREPLPQHREPGRHAG